jgi:uncharacterized RDD family membrane protein YckC
MACPVCGKPSPCAHEPKHSAVLVGPESYDRPEQRYSPLRPSSSAAEEFLIRPQDQPWRQEVVSRVQQHRARRRRRFDPSATMDLDFQETCSPEPAEQQSTQRSPLPLEPPKIIEFPRARAPIQPFYFEPKPRETAADLELAEPVVDAPRILDAPEPPPEQLNLLPTFADIQLAEAVEKVELPPQAAPLAHRVFAALCDMMVVLLASAIFAFGLVMFGRGMPQSKAALLCVLFIWGSLWLIYQYLFLVYAPATLGMQLAQLELCTFKGEPVSISLRRWRVAAGMLSACAVGLGFLWAFVDEDTLSWHDRITQTHLRRINAQT